jgi:type IV secretion system protein TrbG
MRNRFGIFVIGLTILTGCAASTPTAMVQAPLPGDDVGWSPARVASPADVPVAPNRPAVRPAGEAEKVVDYEEGTPVKVVVGVNQGLSLQFEPDEYVVSVKGAYEGVKPADDTDEPWKASIEAPGSKYPLVHLTATRPGLHTSFRIPTSKRLYLVEARSIALSKTLVVRWSYPDAPAPVVATVPSLLPDPSVPATYHGGYIIEPLSGRPTWTPVAVVDDGRWTYVSFPRNLSVQAAPMARLIGANGPELINPVLIDHVLVLDHLVPAVLELRPG